jgi:L-ribulose-5-phosphate 3-epimerase
MHFGLAGWSIHRRFHADALALLDYPQLARDEWGLEAVELNSPFFKARDGEYLNALKENAKRANVALWGIAVDGTGSLCAENPDERAQHIRDCVAWLDIAKTLELSYARFNTGGEREPSEAEIERCADSFAQLATEGEARGVMVCIENHGGLSATPDPIVEVMKRVSSPFCRTLPDFGNFAPEIRYEALDKVVPYAAACHAKFREFDDHGHALDTDIGKIKNIFLRHKFDGRLAIEYEGAGDDGEGVRMSLELLKRTFS